MTDDKTTRYDLREWEVTFSGPLTEEGMRLFEYLRATAQSAPPAPRASLQYFMSAMEAKLRANDHKGGWKSDDWMALYNRLSEEGNELLEALKQYQDVQIALDKLMVEWAHGQLASKIEASQNDLLTQLDAARKSVLKECADVANFAMMIADTCGTLPKTDDRGH